VQDMMHPVGERWICKFSHGEGLVLRVDYEVVPPPVFVLLLVLVKLVEPDWRDVRAGADPGDLRAEIV